MTAVVFTGPTITPEQSQDILPAIYLPPAAHGDIMRILQRKHRPTVIGLIDGRFQSVAGVRHKEILWAMSEGVHVFGAASMGALRAAELTDFGMVGVGAVYEALRSGELEDDDEVAIEHGPAELGFPLVSEAMVDIRATLARAVAQGVIRANICDKLIDIAKAQFFRCRSYGGLLDAARQGGIDTETDNALRAWLPSGRYSAKRNDAIAMLRAIGDFLASDPVRKTVTYRCEQPETWALDVAAAAISQGDGNEIPTEDILDELRLVPETYSSVRGRAFLHVLAMREAARQIPQVDDALDLADAGLARAWQAEGDSPQDWMKKNDLTWESLDTLARNHAREKVIEDMAGPLIERRLLDAMRLLGVYSEMAKRAAWKRQRLLSTGRTDATLDDLGLSAEALLTWHCRRTAQPVPRDTDRYARSFGFVDSSALLRALAKEYLVDHRST